MKNSIQNTIVTSLAALILAGSASAATVGSSVVRRFSDGSTVEGSSAVLVRTEDRITGNFLSTLTPGEAYTIWWVVFNKPENCTGGVCDEDDVLPPPGNVAAEVSVLYATGRATDVNGKGDFGAELMVGDMTNVLFGPGLMDVRNAEVHMVARTHGAIIPDMFQEQISSFNGGCPPNECTDEQFAVFPPNADETTAAIMMMKDTVNRMAQRMGIKP